MMPTFLPLALFAFVSSITPGPNNIMLASSGISFGFVRTIPHMAGSIVGFSLLLALCAVGIGSLVLALPSAHLFLKIAGSAYLLYLAWRLQFMSFDQKLAGQARPMSFFGAALFTFVNPKAWVMTVTSASTFLPNTQKHWSEIGLFCLVFCAVNLPCIAVWVGTGAVMRQYLAYQLWKRVFSGTLICLTIYSVVAMWL